MENGDGVKRAPGFQKGVCTNPNGRPKGAVNQTTKHIRTFFQSLIEDNQQNITDALAELFIKDKKFALTWLKDISVFVIPRMNQVDVTSDSNPIQFILPTGVDPAEVMKEIGMKEISNIEDAQIVEDQQNIEKDIFDLGDQKDIFDLGDDNNN